MHMENAIERLKAMTDPKQQTWDLSPNDVAAISWALKRIEEANRNVVASSATRVFDDSKRVLFPMVCLPWTSLNTEDGGQIKPNSKMNAIGFIPVYENIQTLVADHGRDKEYGTFVL